MGQVAALGLVASIFCYAHMFSPPLVPSRCSLCLQDSLWSQILAMTTHYPDCIAASFLGEAPVFRDRETVVTISIIIQMCIFSPLFPPLFTCFQRFCQGTFSCFDHFWKWKPLFKKYGLRFLKQFLLSCFCSFCAFKCCESGFVSYIRYIEYECLSPVCFLWRWEPILRLLGTTSQFLVKGTQQYLPWLCGFLLGTILLILWFLIC